MSRFRTLLVLATVVCAVLVPVLLGHALAAHGATPVILAGAFLGLALVLGAVQLRGAGAPERRRADPRH
jgi:hypothetical protein